MKTISLVLFFALAGTCAAFETNRPVSVSPLVTMDFGQLSRSNPLLDMLSPQRPGRLAAAFQVPTSPSKEAIRSVRGAGSANYPILMGDANPGVDRGIIHRAEAGIDAAMVYSPDPARRGLVKVKPAPGRDRCVLRR